MKKIIKKIFIVIGAISLSCAYISCSNNTNDESSSLNELSPSTSSSLAANFSISFNSNGGEGTMDVLSGKKDSIVTISENLFTREGFDFESWNTKKRWLW